jgi:hypothetical protein
MTFFIGPEVHHTPAYSKRTLFVEEFQDTKLIESTAREYKTPHISLGTNNTFSLEHDWNDQLTKLLDRGFMVTLEYPAELHSRLMLDLSPGVLQSRNFVPLVQVNVAGLSTTNTNLTVKFDDNSNVGVWTLHFHQIMDSNRFTATSEFIMEEVAPAASPAQALPVRVPVPQVSEKPVVIPGSNRTFDVEAKIKNDAEIGLDPTAPSSLKPEVTEQVTTPVVVNATAAADLYADGAKVDPLSAENSKKPAKSKK